MKLTVLGSGDASASGGRMQTAFYVETDRVNFMIDCGATALTGIKKAGIDHTKLNAVFLTHLHGDHYGGIPYILIDLNTTDRKETLYIFGPEDTKTKTEKLAELLYEGHSIDKNKFKVEIKEYDSDETFEFGNIKVAAYKVKHSDMVNPHALRIECDGRIICYSGDTEWCDNLMKVAQDSDIFIVECSYYDTVYEGHMNFKELSKHLSELKSKKILLTHMSTEMLSHDVPVLKAADGMELII